MDILCKRNTCCKLFSTKDMTIHEDRKGRFVVCPYCGMDNNIPVNYKLVQLRFREDMYEKMKARAAKRGLKITQFIKMAALTFVPPDETKHN